MEQIDQLKSMRDAAKERLEAAIKALETSPDAKLVNSLTALIDDLEDSLGIKSAPKPAAKKVAVEDKLSDSGAATAVEGAEIEPLEEVAKAQVKPAETKPAPQKPAAPKTEDAPKAKPAPKEAEEMSLEDSLEAELLGSDIGKS